MSALGELIGKIIAAVVEWTIQAGVFVLTLLLAAFSPVHRRRLRRRWNASVSQRIRLVIGGLSFAAAAAFFGFSGLLRTEESETTNVIQMTEEEQASLQATKSISSLAGKAAEIISKRAVKQAEENGKSPDSKP